MFNNISNEVKYALKKLENAGFEAFLVGGFVRDLLMNKAPHDADITTSAAPEEIKRVFCDYKTIDTGIKHGTVTVIINSTPLEITTYRIDESYTDSRHPDKVSFTRSLSEDISRRDFTVCSIAYSPERGIIDLFSGREDIERKLIRCVGEPEKRFTEDALRILRALRFSSTLSFEIEEQTKKAIFKCKNQLLKVSKERIFSELSKMLCGENVGYIIRNFSEVLEVVLPEIKGMKGFDQKNFHHIYDILGHTAVVTESIPPLLHLRLAALFHDSGKADCFSLDEKGTGHFYSHPSISARKADEALERLRCDKETRKKVVFLVKQHDAPIEEDERIIKKKLRSMGEEMLRDLITLKRADTKGLAPEFHSRSEHFDNLERIIKDVIEKEDCFSLKDLAVNGNDLIELGYKGKEIGQALNTALEAVIEGRAVNEKQSLIDFLGESLT